MQERFEGSGQLEEKVIQEDILGVIVPEDPKPNIVLEEYYVPTVDPPAWKIATGNIVYGATYPQDIEAERTQGIDTDEHDGHSQRHTSFTQTDTQPVVLSGSNMTDF